jgi:hypothetical protein
VGWAHWKVDTITYIAVVNACEKWDHACRILVENASAIVYMRILDVRGVLSMAAAPV